MRVVGSWDGLLTTALNQQGRAKAGPKRHLACAASHPTNIPCIAAHLLQKC